MLDSVAAILQRARQLCDDSVFINKVADAASRSLDELLRRQAEKPVLNPPRVGSASSRHRDRREGYDGDPLSLETVCVE